MDNTNKVLSTLEEVQEVFKPQAEQVTATNGDYLSGKTVEQAVAEKMAEGNSPISAEALAEFYQKRQTEYAEHLGDKILFYMTRGPEVASVVRLWESELTELVGKEFTGMVGEKSDMPCFRSQENQ